MYVEVDGVIRDHGRVAFRNVAKRQERVCVFTQWLYHRVGMLQVTNPQHATITAKLLR